jgi:hemoglobin/transferrin/lactoferrin receptor protein
MTGAGRVNTMIDGVTQTFRNNAGHGSGGPFAYVDPFLLAGVDVQRGAVAGGDGAGTLAGSANFRTLDIDDLLGEGRDWGLRAGYRHGNNGYGSGRTFAGAWRHSEDGGDRQFGLLAAASSSRSSEYATARGQKNNADPGSQQPSSWLLKARLQPSDQHRLDLSHMRYENDFYHNYPWQISARNQRASYHYTPYSPWIDLRATFAGNKTRLFYPPVEDSSYIGRRTHSSLSSWTLDNTSRFDIGALQARWNTGIKHQSDIYVADTPILRGANPQGRSQLDSVFSTLELQYDIYALTAGLRQDRYRHPWPHPGVLGCARPVRGDQRRRHRRAPHPARTQPQPGGIVAGHRLAATVRRSLAYFPPAAGAGDVLREDPAGRHERCRWRGRQPVPAPRALAQPAVRRQPQHRLAAGRR